MLSSAKVYSSADLIWRKRKVFLGINYGREGGGSCSCTIKLSHGACIYTPVSIDASGGVALRFAGAGSVSGPRTASIVQNLTHSFTWKHCSCVRSMHVHATEGYQQWLIRQLSTYPTLECHIQPPIQCIAAYRGQPTRCIGPRATSKTLTCGHG